MGNLTRLIMRHQGGRRKKYTKIGMCVILLSLVAVLQFRTASAALFRKEEAVHIDPSTIQNATLAIGTHLIYLHSLNEEIYAIALESASDSGQDKWYYKSELAGGMWLDISDAGSIKDITAAGKIVDDSEIEALYFTHHTKSDGITYDLRNNAQVCIFDIRNVYELELMPELEALKLQYDAILESKSSTKTAKRNQKLVENFWEMQVQSDMTDQCDKQIQALQGYYNELVANGADSRETQTVLNVMEKIDSTRRAAVLSMVDSGLTSLQDAVANVEDEEGALELDDNLLTAVGDSQYAIAESLTEAQGNMLVKGNTVVSEAEYELSVEMISNAEKNNYFQCDEQNQKLQYLDNINSGRIVQRQEELNLLSMLIDAADKKYSERLASGVTQQYATLSAKNVSHAALQSRMQEDMAEADATRGELQFLLQAKVDRQENDEAQNYVRSRIQDASVFKTVIKADDYKQEYQNSVTVYLDWLNSLLSKVKDEDENQSKEELLYEQKAALQEQKLQALDGLDLDTAKRIDAKIAEVDSQINTSQTALSEQLQGLMEEKAALEKKLAENPQNSQNAALQAQLSKLEAEIADCQSNLASDSQTANIMTCKNEILRLIAKGDTSEATRSLLEGDVKLLTEMMQEGSALAQQASKEVYQKLLAKSELEGVKAYQDLQNQIETALSESTINVSLSGGELSASGAEQVIADILGIDALFDAQGNLSKELMALCGLSTTQPELSKEEFGKEELSESSSSIKQPESSKEEFGKEESSGSSTSITQQKSNQEDLAAALIALAHFGQETDTESIQALAQGLATALNQSNSDIIFQAEQQGGIAYISAETLAAYLGYRYVWNDTKKSAVLSKGRQFFRFTAYLDTVETETGTTKKMKRPAEFFGELYLPDSFVQEQFDCYCSEISGTDYAVIVNQDTMEKSQEILLQLQQRQSEEGGF